MQDQELEAKVRENCDLRAHVERLKRGLEATQLGMENWEARAMELEQKLRTLENQKNKARTARLDPDTSVKVNQRRLVY